MGSLLIYSHQNFHSVLKACLASRQYFPKAFEMKYYPPSEVLYGRQAASYLESVHKVVMLISKMLISERKLRFLKFHKP